MLNTNSCSYSKTILYSYVQIYFSLSYPLFYSILHVHKHTNQRLQRHQSCGKFVVFKELSFTGNICLAIVCRGVDPSQVVPRCYITKIPFVSRWMNYTLPFCSHLSFCHHNALTSPWYHR